MALQKEKLYVNIEHLSHHTQYNFFPTILIIRTRILKNTCKLIILNIYGIYLTQVWSGHLEGEVTRVVEVMNGSLNIGTSLISHPAFMIRCLNLLWDRQKKKENPLGHHPLHSTREVNIFTTKAQFFPWFPWQVSIFTGNSASPFQPVTGNLDLRTIVKQSH